MDKQELYKKLNKCPKLVLMALISANYLELEDYLKDSPDNSRIKGMITGMEHIIDLTSEALSE